MNTSSVAGIEQIRLHLQKTTDAIVHNSVLDAVEEGKFTQDEWREFAKQRYLAALHFEELLEAGLKKARILGDQELVDALVSNLQDERGIDAQGNLLSTGSHEKWRRDFYGALGLEEDALSSAEPLEGTRMYDESLKHLIDAGDVLTIAGAILLQEFSIPEEFKRIKIGRDLTFPDQFTTQSKDTSEQRLKKGFARLYIDHHIVHDATSHYPNLERALMKYADDPVNVSQILTGVEMIHVAKQYFYKSLSDHLLTS